MLQSGKCGGSVACVTDCQLNDEHHLSDDTFDFDTTRASWIFEVSLTSARVVGICDRLGLQLGRQDSSRSPSFTKHQDDEQVTNLGDEPYSDKTTIKRT